MVLQRSLRGSNSLCHFHREALSCPLLDTRREGWETVDCETLGCGTVWEVSLTLVIGVGYLLRAALGPWTRASLASLGLLQWWGNGFAWFLDHTYLCPRYVELGQEIRTMELCGSDEWQIGPDEEGITFDRFVEHLRMQWPFCWLDLVWSGQKVGHHIQAPWNVPGPEGYLVVMVPWYESPQESTHLRWVGSSLFIYVGYYCWVVHGNQHCLILTLVLELSQGQR